MISAGDLYWLAGLLEGEGSFYPNKAKYPTISVSMTDLDVIERIAALFGNKVVISRRPNDPRHPTAKQQWGVAISGHRAVAWMRVLQPLMGERRGARIAGLLAEWDAVEHKMPKGSGLRSPAKCHPERPVSGGGLCNTCYMRKWRRGQRVRSANWVAA